MDINRVNIGKDKHTIGIHALTENDMNVLVDKLEDLFTMKFPDNLVYKSGLQTRKQPIKTIHTEYLPHYEPNKELANSKKFYLSVDKKDIESIYKTLGLEKKCNKWIWFPRSYHKKYKDHIVECDIQNKYPIYVLSKGRWENPLTANWLMKNNIDFKIIVEKDEYDNYSKNIPEKYILVLPEEYMNKNQGGIPARNYIFHYSLSRGEKAHWILDDNISYYVYNHDSYRMKVNSAIAFRMLEDFMDRYENLYLLGHHYSMFSIPTANHSIAIHNTRVYSSILIRNDVPIIENNNLWLGKYNEDTDLSLRVLLKKLPVVLFQNMTCNKATTGGKGGNTDTIYKEDNNGSGVLKTKELKDKYPDIVKVIKRFGRTHHYIDYIKHFKDNPLIFKKDIIDPVYDIQFVKQ